MMVAGVGNATLAHPRRPPRLASNPSSLYCYIQKISPIRLHWHGRWRDHHATPSVVNGRVTLL